MNDLIQRITNAIIRQEGESPAHQNPGNLRGAPWLHGTEYGKVIAMAGGFWVPTSRAQGIAGAAHVVALHIAQGDSLTQLIGGREADPAHGVVAYAGWAPSSDGNKTAAYIANVMKWANIPDAKLPLWYFIQDQVT